MRMWPRSSGTISSTCRVSVLKSRNPVPVAACSSCISCCSSAGRSPVSCRCKCRARAMPCLLVACDESQVRKPNRFISCSTGGRRLPAWHLLPAPGRRGGGEERLTLQRLVGIGVERGDDSRDLPLALVVFSRRDGRRRAL